MMRWAEVIPLVSPSIGNLHFGLIFRDAVEFLNPAPQVAETNLADTDMLDRTLGPRDTGIPAFRFSLFSSTAIRLYATFR